MSFIEHIKTKYELLKSALGEKQRRLYLAAEAKALGRGGVSQVAKATGVSRNTVAVGLKELSQTVTVKDVKVETNGQKKRSRTRGRRLPVPENKRLRKVGGGRNAQPRLT